MEKVSRYHNNGTIKEQGCLDEGGMRQGKWTVFFRDGQTQVESTYLNDKVHGVFKRYHDNGNLAIESHYVRGENEGLWKEFYPSGMIKEESIYKNGAYFPINFWSYTGEQTLTNGTGKKSEAFGTSGSLVVELYFEKGKFIEEKKLTNGKYGKFFPR